MRVASPVTLPRRLRELSQTIKTLEREIAGLVAQIAPEPLSEPGFDPLIAAKLVGEVAGAAASALASSPARPARPDPGQFRKTMRHRLDRAATARSTPRSSRRRTRPPPPRNAGLHRPETRRRQDHRKKLSAASMATSPAVIWTSSQPHHPLGRKTAITIIFST